MATRPEPPSPADDDTVKPDRVSKKKAAAAPHPAPMMPSMIDAADLALADMPDPVFIARPWIAEGLTIVVGPPKVGKTTLLRQLALACRAGKAFLTSQCAVARVAFLSLEEGERTMRAKLRAMGVAYEALRGVALAFQWPQGLLGVDLLRQWLQANVQVGELALVVIDSLQRFRMPVDSHANQYAQDYEALKMLADLAKEYPGLAILVLHHTRKALTDDPVAAVSGTNGVAAAADNYLILQRMGEKFRLTAGGRLWLGDTDQFELLRTSQGAAWQLAGDWNAEADELPLQQRTAYELLLQRGAMTAKSLAEAMGMRTEDTSGTRHLIGRLKDRGLVEQEANGWRAVRR